MTICTANVVYCTENAEEADIIVNDVFNDTDH